jgi:hypothetical protein
MFGRYKLSLLILLLSVEANGFCQVASYPGWLTDSLKSKGIDKIYELNSYIHPSLLQEDFHGDGSKIRASGRMIKSENEPDVIANRTNFLNRANNISLLSVRFRSTDACSTSGVIPRENHSPQ